ncbi:MAG: EAL domain-containing protein [Gammaproteobacteria bacterium]|nr:MAG: EAL domain-containing protein [Gammaproteobacteria bacterium]
MKDNTQILISTGFLAILALMFSLVFISLIQLQSGTDSMARFVEVTSKKTAAANEMRDAIRLRANSLKTMRLTEDFFERDNENHRFMSYAGKYRHAREQLVDLGMDARARVLHEKLASLMREAQPYNDRAAEMLMNDADANEIAVAMEQAEARQDAILLQLDKLVDLENRNADRALASSRNHYQGTRHLLYVLAAIALFICLLIMRMVVPRIAKKNAQLNYLASHDLLTGLINRREFEVRIDRAITHARAQSATHAIFYMDLDQFKIVNDTCGHATGDELLQQIGKLLLSSVRKRDTLSRLGGDEFGMLLENCPLDKAIAIANNLLRAVEKFQFTRGEDTFTLGICIGVVTLDHSTTSRANVLSAASSACDIAKQSGGNRIQFAHLGNRRRQEQFGQMQWVAHLKDALEHDRFRLYYQPIVPCTGTGRNVQHIEILLRMIDEDGSMIAPGVFLPAAGKYKLLTRIDRWVIEHAMMWLASETENSRSPVMISVNLSGQSVGDPAMLRFIIDRMEATGVSPEQVCFEITETAAIGNIIAATSFMLTLRGRGFKFSLDDFGSSLSSFIYLKKLPVDYLKIDGTFVRDIMSDPIDHAIVRSISELGRLLGKETIAKFVETRDIADELKKLGVNYAQGYAYSQPRPLTDFAASSAPRLIVVSS